MKHIRILTLLLVLVLLCTGCTAGGAAEPTPAPDMSDLPLDGSYAYLRVEVLRTGTHCIRHRTSP